jgi:soluble lytic murein transglycosylase-like protein
MNLRTTIRPRTSASPTAGTQRRPPLPSRRPALLLGAATAGALLVNVLAGGEPAAQADSRLESVSIAEQLGISTDGSAAASSTVVDEETVRPLEQLAASRADRDADQAAAAQAQAAADQAERDRRAAEEAARKAAEEEAARKAAEEAAAAEAAAAEAAAPAAPGPAAAPAAAPAGSFQDYALAQLGGDANEFSCLESLWGRESGWNPNAQNPTSTAYGIPQFLDSTWASTGIAKTSDGYRQIDAGLIYIDSRYGSPCGAWGHSQSTGWY